MRALSEASISELIDRLRTSRIEEFNYFESTKNFSENLFLLIQRPGITSDLISAYRRLPTDQTLRFKLVMVIAYQLQNRITLPNDWNLAADGLLEALRDTNTSVRVAALWGLRFSGHRSDINPVKAMMGDTNAIVRSEADSTWSELFRVTQ